MLGASYDGKINKKRRQEKVHENLRKWLVFFGNSGNILTRRGKCKEKVDKLRFLSFQFFILKTFGKRGERDAREIMDVFNFRN